MPGGLMQLVAYGAEDLYLTGNPQITYFKVLYRRHTNFATEYIEKYFYTLPLYNTTKRTQAKLKIDRDADLVADIYLVIDTPDIISTPEENFKWTRHLGLNFINFVEIDIGGVRVDKQYGQWMQIWSELTISDSRRPAYDTMVGNYYKMRPGFSTYYPNKGNGVMIPRDRLYIPMFFWFCTNPGLALPLIALQYDEVYFYVELNCLNDLFTLGENNLAPCAFFSAENVSQSPPDSLPRRLMAAGLNEENLFYHFVSGDWNKNTFVLANYVYLDEDERRRFAQSSHEYLIPQVQSRKYTGIQQGPGIVDIDMSHPVKELIWVFQRDNVDTLNDWNNYTFVELAHDYLEVKAEYANKLDFLNQKFDANFMESINPMTAEIEHQPRFHREPTFLSAGLSNTQAFNNFTNIMLSGKLIFNGHDRFDERDDKFFNALQPYKYHTHAAPAGVYVYSFALQPEDAQPSGTANFSRINKIQLYFNIRRGICLDENSNPVGGPNLTTPANYNLYLYAMNFNILRIMGGMGGLAFEL